ncbi:MAG: hypothetical protein HY905_16880 [Deltaproteobacteria bacterium]|nr:hypothetical protein [Deltaproteobacteria bacterium]
MTALILFDADQDWEEGGPVSPPVCRADGVVVVFGCNTATVCRRCLSFDRIRFVAHRLARLVEVPSGTSGRCAPDPVSFEFVLTLTMPEAVDAALVRMLVNAGAAETAGSEFRQVLLVSDDLGLRRDVFWGLSRRRPWLNPDRKAAAGALGRSVWRFDVASRPLIRSFPREPNVTEKPCPASTGPVVVIDRPELAAWAARQRLQPTGNLPDIARQVTIRPAVLTQVGLTRATVRGVDRLRRRAASPGAPIPLGACDARDGLEYCMSASHRRADPAARRQVQVLPTALGPGAVRLHCGDPPDLVNTLATRLPLWVVRAAAQAGGLCALRVRWPALDDEKALAAVRSEVAPADEHVTVRLSAVRVDRTDRSDQGTGSPPGSCGADSLARRGLGAQIERPGDSPPRAWWVLVHPHADRHSDVDARAKLRVEDAEVAGALPGNSIHGIAGYPAVTSDGLGIVLRGAAGREVEVTIDAQAPVPANTIVPGTDRDARRVAVLALGESLPPRWRGNCACIQDLDPADLAEQSRRLFSVDVLEKLQRFPLLVAIGPHREARERPRGGTAVSRRRDREPDVRDERPPTSLGRGRSGLQ